MAKKRADNKDVQSLNSTEVEENKEELSPNDEADQSATTSDIDSQEQEVMTPEDAKDSQASVLDINDEKQAEAQTTSEKTSITSEVAISETYNDEQMMSRLRSQPLMASEIYGEAQIFMSQNFNIDAILQSQEPILVQNTIEILEKLEHWNDSIPTLLADDVARTRELAEHYLLRMMRNASGVNERIVEIIKDLIENTDKRTKLYAALTAFADKIRALLVLKLSQGGDDTASSQLALSMLLEILPVKSLTHMLFDPAPLVRLAVIRYYSSLPSIDLDVMSSSLIVLKDSDEEANGALIKMFAKFAVFPELIIPQLLIYLTRESSEHKQAAIEAIKRYGSEAVAPVLAALDEQSDQKAVAVAAVIASMPQRFTDPLIAAYASFHTKGHARQRLANILAHHNDPKRTEDIHIALYGDSKPVVAPAKKRKVIPVRQPVLDNAAFYKDILSDKELKAIDKIISDSALIALLGDASNSARINALGIIRLRKKASGSERACILTWMKSPDLALASAALDSYIALFEKKREASSGVLLSLKNNENADVRDYIFEKMTENQELIDEVIILFKQDPKPYFLLVDKLIKTQPSKATINGIISCISSENTPQCIASAIQILVRSPGSIDYKSIKKRVMELIENPPTLGELRVMTRHYAVHMIRRIGVEETDKEIIEQLRAYYKKSHNIDHKTIILNLFKPIGEEIFDNDDEEDEFDDLRD